MRLLRSVICLLIVFSLCITTPANLQAIYLSSQPQIGAKAAALMDVSSGRMLHSHNAHEQLPMASTTKIMTAILAIESGRLHELVTVSGTAVRVEPSAIWLVAGEQMSLLHLVYGLMLRSGNDAACAIAEHLAGSVGAFAEQMNRKARELGMLNTNFTNPHGLPDAAHYTTAHDLVKLSAYALRNPQFTSIVSTKSFSIPAEGGGSPRLWHNKNRLLQDYPGADGVKTGWTRAAGHCLVASANRNGQRLVAVVLHSPDDWGETAALLNYGFANYRSVSVVTPGQFLQEIILTRGHPRRIAAVAAVGFSWPVGRGEQVELGYLLQIESRLPPSLKKGERLGYLLLTQGGETVAKIPVVAAENVVPTWWLRLFQDVVDNYQQLLLRRGKG